MDHDDLNSNQSQESPNSPVIPDGYLALPILSQKYGYHIQHLRRLIRSGRVEAIRYGTKRNWYIHPTSLENHLSNVSQNAFQSRPVAPSKIIAETPNKTLSHIWKGILSIMLGLFILTTFYLPEEAKLFDVKIDPRSKSVTLTQGNLISSFPKTTLAFWDKVKDLFSGNDIVVTQIIEKTIIRQIYHEASNNEQATINKKEPESVVKEIIREIQSLPSDVLSSLDSRISDLDSKLGTLNFELSTFARTVPTIIQLPPSNTKGVGNITLNPQKVDTETLSVSSSATLSSLTVDNNAVISGNLTVTGTTTFSNAITSNRNLEIQGTASASYGLFGTLQVGGFSSASYSRFGTDTTSHSNYISTTNDLLISGDLEVNSSAQFDSFLQVGANTLYVNPTSGNVGIGTTNPSSKLQVVGSTLTTNLETQGTASASYLLTGNTLQVGGFSSAAYSRFGINTTGHSNYISTTNDLLISGDLEVDGSISAQFASASRMFITNPTASASLSFRGNGSGGANQSIFSIGVGNGTERLDIFNNDNSPIVTIASGGNVGIGTTVPGAKLEVHQTSGGGWTNPGGIHIFHSNNNAYLSLQSNVANGRQWNLVSTDSPAGAFRLIDGTAGVTALQIEGGLAANALYIKSDGNVGIGTTGPVANLQVLTLNSLVDTVNVPTGVYIATSDALAANMGGKLSFGAKVNTGGDIRVFANIAGRKENATSDNYSGYLQFATTTSGGTVTERMRIDSAGNVGIGTISPGGKLSVFGSLSSPIGNTILTNTNTGDDSLTTAVSALIGTPTTGTGARFITFRSAATHDQSGDEVGKIQLNNNAVAYVTTSDQRLKENIQATALGLETLNQIQVRDFNFIADLGKVRKQGFVAQELYSVYPEAVSLGGDISNPWGVDYGRLTPLIIKSVQELSHRTTGVYSMSGNVGIGTTNPSSHTLQVTGSAGKTVGGTTWADLSDSRLKNIQGEVKGTALDTLMQLRPIKFKWNDTHQQLYGGSTDNLMYGFVAQEIMEVIPEFVKEGGDGYFWYNPSGFESILTAAVQEQQGQMASLSKQFYVTDMRDMTNFLQIRDIVASQSRDMNRDIASLSFRLDELEQKIASQSQNMPTPNQTADAVGTGQASEVFNFIVSKFNEMFGIVFEEGLMKVANIVTDRLAAREIVVTNLNAQTAIVDTLEVNTAASFNGKGITLRDRTSGNPYCVFIDGGQMTSTFGECGAVTPDSPSSSDSSQPSQDASADTAESPAPVEPSATSDVSTSQVADTEQNTSTSDVNVSSTSDVTESELTPTPSPETTTIEATSQSTE